LHALGLLLSLSGLATGCVSQATTGKIMAGTGAALIGVGALNMAGVFGGDCQEDRAVGQTSCRSSGSSDMDAAATFGIGGALLATGAVLWALSPRAEKRPVARLAQPAAAPPPNPPESRIAAPVKDNDIRPRHDPLCAAAKC
jgi:hypothetical protein